MAKRNSVEEAGIESFPASDAPEWTGSRVGPPARGKPGSAARHERLIASLNEDLAGELGTIVRYTYQAGKAAGPTGEYIRSMFREEIPDELSHAAFLTDVIVDLGGEPTTTPADFAKPARVKEMLQLDLDMEMKDASRYIEHARLAEQLGEVELTVKLEEIAADEAGHARGLRRLLRGM